MRDLARFRQLLFANQTLNELLTCIDLAPPSSEQAGWLPLMAAAEEIRAGRPEEAIRLLLKLTSERTTETRVLLWSWTALRGLGVTPPCRESGVCKGAVIEVPLNPSLDVLAAYQHGS